jgi:hypothetical protein
MDPIDKRQVDSLVQFGRDAHRLMATAKRRTIGLIARRIVIGATTRRAEAGVTSRGRAQ